MADLFGDADSLLSRNRLAGTPEAGAPTGTSEFTKGLRSGVLGAGSQIESFAGGTAAALGADQLGQRWLRGGADMAQEAQAAGPRVSSYRDIGGLRDLSDYGAGLFGQALPSIGLGVGAGALTAATGGGALAALGAGALTQLPLEAGDVFQRQQLDPATAGMNAGEKALRAYGTGALSAAGQAIVPAALGGKLVGAGVKGAVQGAERGAAHAAEGGFMRGLGGATLKDAGIEGLSEGGGELVKQQGVGPDWATPDWQAAAENAVGGAIVGGPLGAAGHAATALHTNKQALTDAVGSIAKSGTEALKRGAGAATDAVAGAAGAAKTEAVDFAAKIKEAANPAATDENTVANDGVGPESFEELQNPATPRERLLGIVDQGLTKATDAGKRLGKFLQEKSNLSDEDKTKVDRLVAGTADAADRAWAATKSAGQKAADTFMDNVGKLAEKLPKRGEQQDQYPDGSAQSVNAQEGALHDEARGKRKPKKSEDYSGVREQIVQDLLPHIPEELHSNPQALARVGEAVRQYIGAVKTGDLDQMEGAAKGMHRLFGDETENIIGNIYDKLATNDDAATNRFIENTQKSKTLRSKDQALLNVVTGALPKDSKANAQELVDHLVGWASGNSKVSNIAAMSSFRHGQIRDAIQQTFGAKTDTVLAALEKHIHAVSPTTMSETVGSPETGPTNDYYGAGSKAGGMKLMESPEAHAARNPDSEHGSAATQLMKKLKEKFPDREVKFVSVSDAAEEMGWSPERVKAALEAKDIDPANADHFGFVATSRIENPDKLGETQIEGMKHDSKKDPNGLAKLVIPDGMGGKTNIDAVKLTKHFLKNSKDLGTEDAKVRMARAFHEGMAALATREHEQLDLQISKAEADNDTEMVAALKARQKNIGAVEAKPDLFIGTNNGEKMTAGDAAKVDVRSDKDIESDLSKRDIRRRLDSMRDAFKAEKDPEQKKNIKTAFDKLAKETSDERDANIINGDEPFVPNDSEHLEDNPGADNVHQAAAKGTLKPVTYNADGTPRADIVGATATKVAKGARDAVLAVADGIEKTKAPGADKVAARLRTLVASMESMSDPDRKALLQLKNAKKPSDVVPVISDLAKKYKDVIAARDASGEPVLGANGKYTTVPTKVKSDGDALSPEARERQAAKAAEAAASEVEEPNRPKAQAAKKAALIKAASSSDPALLNEIKTTENAVGLQNSVKALNHEIGVPDLDQAFDGVERDLEDGLIRSFTDLKSMPDVKEALANLNNARKIVDEDPTLTPEQQADANHRIDDIQHRFEASIRSWEAGHVQVEANQATLDNLKEAPEGAVPADFKNFSTPLGEMLDKVAPHMTPAQQAVARAVKKLASHVSVFKDNLAAGMMGIYGISPEFEAIGIAKENNATAAQTMLHEGVHASTMIALEKDKNLAGIARTLMRHVVSADQALSKEYGLTDEHEFMAEALSNPAFQERLKQIAANGLVDARLSKYTAWDAFVDIVRRALGMEPGDRNALIQAIELGGVVMRKQNDISTVGMGPVGLPMRLGLDGKYALASTVKAMNERMEELVKDPDVAYNLQKTNPQNGPSAGARADAEAVITQSLGKSVAVAWEKLPHAGEFDRDITGDVIRLSVYGLNPKSTAYHESLHGFFAHMRDAGMHQVNRVLEKAASQPAVKRWMENHFKNEPAVLQQLRTDPEERAAYMYQLYNSEPSFKAQLNPQATSIFGKIAEFFRSVTGIWSNDERAIHIMEHFQSGEYAKNIGKPDAAALLGSGTNRALEQFKGMAQPLSQLGDTVFGAGSARLRDTGVAAINGIADLIKPLVSGGENVDTGYLAASRAEFTARLNKFGESVSGASKQQINDALVMLQTKTLSPHTDPEVNKIVDAVKKTLQDLGGPGGYIRKTGIDMGNLGPDYFPRVWDAHTIATQQKAFLSMVDKYVKMGVYSGDPKDLLRKLVTNDGNNFDVDTRQPGFQSGKERALSMFDHADVEPFLSKDLYQTMSSYISQATRRAEWARRFGPEGKGLNEMLHEAEQQGATKEQLAMTEKYLKGITGTLGDGINPEARRLMGNAIIYQNIRLLPLAIFSSVVDPLGIALRGGTMGDAFTAFKRGMREIPQNFKKYDPASRDSMTKLAETLGVIENAALMHSLGALYSQGMTGSTGRKVNDTFFRFNLMEQYNRSMRVSATEAALKFVETHSNYPTKDSKRWMDELNLTPKDVRVDPQTKRVRVTEADGLSPEHADKMRDAVNKWVDGAILRPDQADKPIWFNDPHWALISHLKQFTYAFQHTIINRVIREAKEGNYKPAAILGSYVPVMIAADLIKGMIQGGGDTPSWKKDWGASDYAWSGVQRAGLLGVGQFGVDAATDIHRGGSGFGAMTGPTVDQLTDGAKVVGGSGQFESFAMNSMPANALYKNLNTGE